MNIDKGLTLGGLFTSEQIMGAVIDRLQAEQQENILWKNFLSFRPTRDRVWTVKYGIETGVVSVRLLTEMQRNPCVLESLLVRVT